MKRIRKETLECVGKKYNHLTILEIKYKFNYTRRITMAACKCDCGNKTTSNLAGIKRGRIKSCGCLRLQHLKNYRGAARKYSSLESAARDIWNFYKKDSNLDFEFFFKLSQMTCFYCGDPPGNKLKSRNAEFNLKNGSKSTFVYNGLDRVNNSRPHDKDNVVPSCFKCNWAKSDRGFIEFIKWAHLVASSGNSIKNKGSEGSKNSFSKPIISNAKSAWRNGYSKDGLSFKKFLELSQQNCFYCNKKPSNKFAKAYWDDNYAFIYNGLDRIDSSKGHINSNLVPCCKYCNRSKLNLSIDDFYLLATKISKQFGEYQ